MSRYGVYKGLRRITAFAHSTWAIRKIQLGIWCQHNLKEIVTKTYYNSLATVFSFFIIIICYLFGFVGFFFLPPCNVFGGRVSKQLVKLDVLSVNKILTRLQFACARNPLTTSIKMKKNKIWLIVVKYHRISSR